MWLICIAKHTYSSRNKFWKLAALLTWSFLQNMAQKIQHIIAILGLMPVTNRAKPIFMNSRQLSIEPYKLIYGFQKTIF